MATGYLYILWSPEYSLCKLGISARPEKRIADHAGNSSNPVEYLTWSLAKFEDIRDARQVEQEACRRLRSKGLAHAKKRELFSCGPAYIGDLVSLICRELNCPVLHDVPKGLDELRQLDFVDIPAQVAECFDDDRLQWYKFGFRNALWVLSHIRETTLTETNLMDLLSASLDKSENELWIVLFNNLQKNADKEQLKAFSRAFKEISDHNHHQFRNWQRLDDHISWD